MLPRTGLWEIATRRDLVGPLFYCENWWGTSIDSFFWRHVWNPKGGKIWKKWRKQSFWAKNDLCLFVSISSLLSHSVLSLMILISLRQGVLGEVNSLTLRTGDFHLKPHCITRLMRGWLVIGGDWWWLMGGLGSHFLLPRKFNSSPRILSYCGLKVTFQGQTLKLWGGTLPESNKKPLKIGHAKGISSTQNHWFSGDMLVFREGTVLFFLGPDTLFLLGKPEMIVWLLMVECRLWSMPKITSWNLKMMVWDDDFPLPGVYPQVSY